MISCCVCGVLRHGDSCTVTSGSETLREVRRGNRKLMLKGERGRSVCVRGWRGGGGGGEGVVSNSNDSLPWTIDDNHNSGHTWSCRSTFVICTQNRKLLLLFFVFWAYEFPIQMYSKAMKLVGSGRVGKTLDWGKRTRVSMGFEFRSRELPPPFPAPHAPPGALSLLSRSMVGSEFCPWTYLSP